MWCSFQVYVTFSSTVQDADRVQLTVECERGVNEREREREAETSFAGQKAAVCACVCACVCVSVCMQHFAKSAVRLALSLGALFI